MVTGLRRSFLAPWVLVSMVLHVLVMLGTGGSGLIAGNGASFGDGFGGESIELEIVGPRDEPAHGAHVPSAAGPAQPLAPEEPAPAPQEPAEPVEPMEPAEELALEGDLPVEIEAAHVATPRPEPREQPVTPGPEAPAPPQGASPVDGSSDTDDVDDPSATEEASPADAQSPAGTDGAGTTAGPPPGDVAGLILGSAGIGGARVSPRQALLPNSGVCSDPVVGVWRAQKYRTNDHTWVRFVLRVRRESGDGLSGTITSRIWTGNRSNPRPGECTAFGMDHTWRMRARGRLTGDQLVFNSVGGARLVRQDCPRGDSRYAPDRFSGQLHALREVYESTNNDGAFDIDEPYTFRRVSCE